MTRLSTGYTFLNIQDHSKYITNNIEKIQNTKAYHIGKKYEFLDNIFLNVLKNNPDKMPKIFLMKSLLPKLFIYELFIL